MYARAGILEAQHGTAAEEQATVLATEGVMHLHLTLLHHLQQVENAGHAR